MSLNLPFEVAYILHQLQAAGFTGYIVGGAVRDLVMGQATEQISDYDFTTDAKPEQIQALFANSFYENTFGTVSFAHEHLLEQIALKHDLPADTLGTPKPVIDSTPPLIDLQQASKIHSSLQEQATTKETKRTPTHWVAPFEVTTYRSDGQYLDHRRPDQVVFGTSLHEDLQRRDFTINALAISIKQSVLSEILIQKQLQSNYSFQVEAYTLIDEHQGQLDLEKKIIRTVGSPTRRFAEDALRMLRAVRLAVQLEMNIETDTYTAIVDHRDSLKFVSFERIRDEFFKILTSNQAARGIELLDETGLLDKIIPELYAGRGMQQRGHHISDVWTHSIDALRHCPSKDPVVRLATLLHDIGKPLTYKEEGGAITFYNHDIVGSRLASKIAARLKLSKRDTERIFTLVRYHMFHYQPDHSDASIRRFMRRVGLENIDDILDLREGDRLGSGARKTSWRLEEMKVRIVEQLNQPMGLDDLALDGHDLMEQFDLKPGPILGKTLNQLLEQVFENPELNTKETLLKEAAKIIQSAQTITPAADTVQP